MSSWEMISWEMISWEMIPGKPSVTLVVQALP